MGFIKYIEAKYMTTIGQSPGGKRCKYAFVSFLYSIWSSIMSLEGRLWKVKCVHHKY